MSEESLNRDIGRMEAELANLSVDLANMLLDIKAINADLRDINAALSELRGGHRVLMAIAAAVGALVTVASQWMLSSLGRHS